MKPYRSIPIEECREALEPIPKGVFAFFDPHPYVEAGAPYEGVSPWMLRKSVLEALKGAQEDLQKVRPGWKIILFDAYRPNRVQAYMVEKEISSLAKAEGLDGKLTPEQHKRLQAKALELFADPSENPRTPPPHSTGAVIDLTLVDEKGRLVNMGSPVDENSDRSKPDYFAGSSKIEDQEADANRKLLYGIMAGRGFRQAESEWWHFSYKDQYWAWLEQRAGRPEAKAVYGRADLVNP